MLICVTASGPATVQLRNTAVLGSYDRVSAVLPKLPDLSRLTRHQRLVVPDVMGVRVFGGSMRDILLCHLRFGSDGYRTLFAVIQGLLSCLRAGRFNISSVSGSA